MAYIVVYCKWELPIMSATHTRTERLDCRITAQDKRLLERAAEKSGLRLSDFVVSTLVVAAREALREDEPIRLSREDWDGFVASLDADPKPNPRLDEAMAEFAKGTFENGSYTW
jgi:uncharacterized protein (DUF1778 family)